MGSVNMNCDSFLEAGAEEADDVVDFIFVFVFCLASPRVPLDVISYSVP